MLTQNTLDTLRRLKLIGMSDALERQRAQPDTHDLAFEDRLALRVDHEVLHRENRRLARLLKTARLRVPACVEDIDYRHPRGLERSRMAALASSDWIRQALNLCLIGPLAAARPGWRARWAIKPVVRACPCAICACRVYSSSCASPTATALTRG
jgi:DNA replication protein DnaC